MSITLESVKSNCLLEQVINTYVTYWYLQTNYHGKKSHIRYFQETRMCRVIIKYSSKSNYNKIQLGLFANLVNIINILFQLLFLIDLSIHLWID
jgi:hypothetical protein